MDCPSTPAAPLFALTRLYASQTSLFEIQNGFALFTRLLPSLVDLQIKADNAAPSLHPRYGTSPLLQTAPSPCPASVLSPLWSLPLGFLPYHRNDRFPRSTQEPGSRSRHLYAGRRSGNKQVSPELIRALCQPPVLTSSRFSTPHQWFACARLLDPHLTQSLLCLFLNAHYPGSLPAQLKVVWSLLLQAGSEGPPLISCATSWRTGRYPRPRVDPFIRSGCR